MFNVSYLLVNNFDMLVFFFATEKGHCGHVPRGYCEHLLVIALNLYKGEELWCWLTGFRGWWCTGTIHCIEHQCCGSGIIYSGSGSSYELLEFRIQMRIRILLSLFGKFQETHLKINQKEEFTNYLPFSISYYCPTVQQCCGAGAAWSRHF